MQPLTSRSAQPRLAGLAAIAAGAALATLVGVASHAPAGAQAPGERAPGRPAEPRPPEPPMRDGSSGPARETRRPSNLDDLFARLAAASDETEAKGVAGLIERRFARSGSDTADLLSTRAGDALKGGDAALAVELLDRVTQLRPDWAEAWNRRAAAFFRLDDPARALADLETALTREPRHFEAWMALGHVEMATGDKRRALVAYRQALKLHPFLDGVKAMIGRLAPDIDGRDL